MSSIHFVGGEKGGVGKSVFSRLLSQYFLDHQWLYAGFDADQSHGTLTRFYPEFTKAIRLDDFEGADQIMETALGDEVNVVVDLPAQSERFLTRWLEDNDVAGLCADTGVAVHFWYLVDDGRDSASLAQAFLSRFGQQLNVTLVRNHGRGEDFSLLDEQLEGAGFLGANTLDLPALHANTMRKIDRTNLNFWAASNLEQGLTDGLTLMERQRVRVWKRKAEAQLERHLERQLEGLKVQASPQAEPLIQAEAVAQAEPSVQTQQIVPPNTSQTPEFN